MSTNWTRTTTGEWFRTVTGKDFSIFVVVVRKPGSWKWVGYGNGKPLGEFDGIANAKKKAPEVAKALVSR